MKASLFVLILSTTLTACGPGELGDEVEDTPLTRGSLPTKKTGCDTSITAHWQVHSYLGAPVQASDVQLLDGGRFRDYQYGSIYVSPRQGCAMVVRNGFWARWTAEGREQGPLGYPIGEEVSPQSGRSTQLFERGTLYWDQYRGIFELRGAISDKVRVLGAGFPLSDQFAVSGGERVDLELGASVWASAATGARSVRNGIRDHYFWIGAEQSRLGFPTSDEICDGAGGCLSRFQFGTIRYQDGRGTWVEDGIEEVALWRLQVEIETCDQTDASTDDTIWIQLTDDAGKRFRLDLPGDDFERASTRIYDLSTGALGVSKISDITQLVVGKSGHTYYGTGAPVPVNVDAWCMQSIKLIPNNRENGLAPIFSASIPGGVWIDGNDGLPDRTAFSSGALRADPRWGLKANPEARNAPLLITHTMFEDMIAGKVGHIITDNDAYWGHLVGPRWVEVTQPGSAREQIHVDIDLAVNVAWSDPELDVQFDLVVACDPATGVLSFTPTNKTQRVSGTISVLAFLEGPLNALVEEIASGMVKLTASQASVGTCPSIIFQGNGDVGFGNWAQ